MRENKADVCCYRDWLRIFKVDFSFPASAAERQIALTTGRIAAYIVVPAIYFLIQKFQTVRVHAAANAVDELKKESQWEETCTKAGFSRE